MKILSRRDLYDLVWAKPMTELAKEFGISDVALHKKCKKHGIPTPGLGYWAKIAAGQRLKQAPFQENSSGWPNLIRFSPSRLQYLPQELQEAYAKAKAEAKKERDKAVPSMQPEELQPCVERLKRKLETAQMRNSKCAQVQDPNQFSIAVAPASFPRLLAILDTLVREAGNKGYKIEPGPHALQLNVEGEAITLHIYEKNDVLPHEPTEKEKATLQRWEKECEHKRKRGLWISEYDKPKVPEFDYPYNGQLVVELDKTTSYRADGIRRRFSDGKKQRLENKIAEILATAGICAAAIKAERIEEEKREREREASARRWEKERRREGLEKKRIESLKKFMGHWQEAKEIRVFAEAVESQLPHVEPKGAPKVKDWITWARAYADKVDPLFDSVPVLEQEKDLNSWEY